MGKSTDELASLEQRIKEMEDRLRKTKSQHGRPSIASISGGAAPGSSNDADMAAADTEATPAQGTKDEDSKTRSRPGTARATQQAPSSGNMPPTPGASEGEYYLVSKDDLDDAPR